jgi:hypothetical protein
MRASIYLKRFLPLLSFPVFPGDRVWRPHIPMESCCSSEMIYLNYWPILAQLSYYNTANIIIPTFCRSRVSHSDVKAVLRSLIGKGIEGWWSAAILPVFYGSSTLLVPSLTCLLRPSLTACCRKRQWSNDWGVPAMAEFPGFCLLRLGGSLQMISLVIFLWKVWTWMKWFLAIFWYSLPYWRDGSLWWGCQHQRRIFSPFLMPIPAGRRNNLQNWTSSRLAH